MNPARILIVEDQSIVALDLRDRLTRLGYDVPAAIACGEDVAAKTAEIQPDLILMDIVLKGQIDGIAAVGTLPQNSSPPVIFITSHSDDRTVQRAISAGPYGYVLKPFEEASLQAEVEKLLGPR
jgi:CheY-like chemotaxis protein